ncbi:MAG TPA: MoxR family ATPase [Noviherbaspirillum sp.]|jgi:MoxR-like ATPase|uniref:AAA family ATPase n=1 Tax=Noviherbaspirillum sp. TaxID=1926288 RepID=UPI002DDCE93D|nr:MoxR family ATPase [Noviherbaspirillum sp.]HEV2612211.1 MoxR family ATPase [Noviherbaspirillum sp.]
MAIDRLPASVDEVAQLLSSQQYIAERHLATTLYLAMTMGRPMFLEGEAGVGKTEVAKALAGGLGRRLVRLQCYEGLDIANAVYEWNYPRQMIEIRLAEAAGEVSRDTRDRLGADIFTDRFLIKRPLLQALESTQDGPPVLLIDELDRADEPFEAYLLEVLAEYQVTIPEFGTVRAERPPLVVVTSNRTREIHDAVKRRCFYHWVDYPDKARELEIVRRKVPQAADALSRNVVAFIARLRGMALYKAPGVAETIDWAAALTVLDRTTLDAEAVQTTLGVLLKYEDDIAKLDADRVAQLISDVQVDLAGQR